MAADEQGETAGQPVGSPEPDTQAPAPPQGDPDTGTADDGVAGGDGE